MSLRCREFRFRVFIALWGLLFAITPASAQVDLTRYELTTAQVSELNKGEVVVVKLPPPGDAGVRFRAFKKMSVAPAKLKPVFIECEHFKDFMPRTLKSVVSNKKEQSATCEIVVDMPFPFSDLWSVVDTSWGETSTGVWTRKWSLVKGSFRRNEGSWTVISTAVPNESIAVYEASVDPDVPIPDMILRAAQVNTIPELMQAVLARAQHR
ncbi:MAG: SRPBCC family protein [Bradymonadia bacterium]